ncbi:MAG: phospholipase D-like domain-containing protein [Kofleriaceae bacterium]
MRSLPDKAAWHLLFKTAMRAPAPKIALLGSLGALAVSVVSVAAGPGCMTAPSDIEDGETDGFPSGKADGGIDEGSPEALGVLALVNDAATTVTVLDGDAGLSVRVAKNIVRHRQGGDAADGTGDDDRFDTLAELDAIPYVGPAALNALLEYARERGLIGSSGAANIDVIFSPQTGSATHNARIASMINSAQHSLDIAIYSYSDAGIASALRAAVARGVDVRFLFETANDDRKLPTEAERAASKSGRIEADGIDVRWVNKILHHKILIVDGPRDDASRVATAKLVTGSANWSAGAATNFDENTLFVENSPELIAAYQHEFDILWAGSREFVGPAPAQPHSTANLAPDQVADDPDVAALFTSPNFRLGGADHTTWSVDKSSTVVSDAWVHAIEGAQSSIHIASGHLRLRPVAEALVAKKQENPNIDIKVYLDQQEFLSQSAQLAQLEEVDACLANATTANARRDCLANDFLFSKTLVDAGIDVRFKSYAYRWDYTYAPQMHSKYMVIDGGELISGSYNLSMNAEQATFENALHLRGAANAALIARFEDNFATMWGTARSPDRLPPLRDAIANDQTIPLVFSSLALTWPEFDALRALIRDNCSAVDSAEYRMNPAAHRSCPRQ